MSLQWYQTCLFTRDETYAFSDLNVRVILQLIRHEGFEIGLWNVMYHLPSSHIST